MPARLGLAVLSRSAAVLGAVAGLLVVLAARLAVAPLDLAALVPAVERSIAEREGGVVPEIGGLKLDWLGWRDGLVARVENVRLIDRNGAERLRLPRFSVGLDAAALLGHGVPAPGRIAVYGARLVLGRDEDGRIRLRRIDLDADPAPTPGASSTRAPSDGPLAALLGKPDPTRPLGALRRVILRDGRLVFEDAATGLTLVASGITADLDRDARGIEGRVTGGLGPFGRGGRFEARGTFDRATGRLDAAADVRALDPAPFTPLTPLLGADALDIRPDGRLRASVAGGRVETLDFVLSAAGGRFRWPGAPPVAVDDLRVVGGAEDDFRRLVIDRATLVSAGARLEGAALAARYGGDYGLTAELTADGVGLDRLGGFWPPFLAGEAREWVTRNVVAGRGRDLRLRVDLPSLPLRKGGALPPNALTGGFAFDGAAVHYRRPLPPATGLRGTARFDATSLTFAFDAGACAGLAVEGGEVALAGFGPPEGDTRLTVDVGARGPVPAALRLLNAPPLTLLRGLAVDPDRTRGEVRGRFTLGTTLKDPGEPPSPPEITYDATLTGADLPRLRPGLDILAADARLTGDAARLNVEGTARVNGFALNLDGFEGLRPGASPRRRYAVATLFGDADRARLNWPDQPILEGPVPTELTLEDAGGGRRIEATLDLGRAAVAAAALRWSKPAGAPGSVAFTLRQPDVDRPEALVERLKLEAGGLRAEGAGRVRVQPFRIEEARVDRLRFRRTDAAVLARPLPGGGFTVDLRGRSLDLRPYLDPLLGRGPSRPPPAARPAPPAPSAPEPPLVLTLDVREARLSEASRLYDLKGRLRRETGEWREANLNARLDGGPGAVLLAEPRGRDVLLRVEAADAGAFLAWAGYPSTVSGGDLVLAARVGRQAPSLLADGQLVVRDFRLIRAPFVARLLAVASLTAINDMLAGEGVPFDLLYAPFTLDGDRLRLRDARLRGSQIGLLADGTVGFGGGGLDLAGTLVPARGLNAALGNIPLLGRLLTGGQREGVFAFTYAATGPLDAPRIAVNPLSVLAPGIIRDLFAGGAQGTDVPPSGNR